MDKKMSLKAAIGSCLAVDFVAAVLFFSPLLMVIFIKNVYLYRSEVFFTLISVLALNIVLVVVSFLKDLAFYKQLEICSFLYFIAQLVLDFIAYIFAMTPSTFIIVSLIFLILFMAAFYGYILSEIRDKRLK